MITVGGPLKNLLYLFTAVFLSNSWSALPDLSKEFLAKNSGVFQEKVKTEISNIEKDIILAQSTWGLSYDYFNNDNNLENSSTTFTVTGLKTTGHSLGLSKKFGWGGELSLTNNAYSYESTSKSYQFNQKIAYEQNLGKDLFGRQFRSTVNQYQHLANQQKFSSKNSIQGKLKTFALVYTQAQLQKSLYDLQLEAQKRAERRLSLIKKKVRDGLREKVDLLQSQTDLLNQKEQVQSAAISFNNQLESLVSYLERPVTDAEVKTLALESWEKLPEGDLENNLSKKSLSAFYKANQNAYESAELDYLPAVTLSGSVKNNDYNATQGETFSEGKLGGDKKEVTIGLNLTWALGLEKEKLEKAKARLNLESSKKLLDGTDNTLVKTEDIFKKKLEQLNKNIEFSKSRLVLAENTLKEYTKLYNRGRSDLDQVIRAEESLINTQVSHLRYIANRREVLFDLSSLYGTLEDYITGK